MADGSIIIDTKIDGTGLDKQLSNLKGSLQNTTDSLNNLTSKALIGFAAIGAAISPSIKLASDLAESANAARVVFGEATSTIEEFGRVAQEQAGLTSAEFNQMAAQIGASLINAGQSQEDAAKQSVELTKRAADMASIFNTDVSEALTAIQAGLRGESEPLRRFAVGLDEASVSAKAVEMGLAKSASTVDAYGKSQARLAIIMQQSSRFQGDFVNTSDQLANSTRITTAMIKEEAAQAGAKLLPIVLDVVKGFLEWAKEGDRLANIMQSIAGSIKWAVESGFAQGVLAAVVAIKALTLAMAALSAISAMTPLGALIIALGVATGAMVAMGVATETYNKQLEENNRLSSENKKTANEIIGPTEGLAGAQKLSAEQVEKLIKLYPTLNGVISAGVTDLKTAREEMEKAAEAQRQLNLALAVKQKTDQLNATYQSISRIRKEQERLNNDLSGVPKESAAYQNAKKDIDRFASALLIAEANAEKLKIEISKLKEESFFGPSGFKPTVGHGVTSAIEQKVLTSDEKADLKKAEEGAAKAGQDYLDSLPILVLSRKTSLETTFPTVGEVDSGIEAMAGFVDIQKAYLASTSLLFKKLEDGAITWDQYSVAVENSSRQALEALYAAGLTAKSEGLGGEFVRALIGSLNANIKSADLEETGVSIIERLAAGIIEAAPQVLSAARKTIEIVGQVFSAGVSIISRAAQGIGSVISGMATFDPGKIFEDIQVFSKGIKDFFANDIAQSPTFFNAGVALVSNLIQGIEENLPKTLEIMGNAMTAIIETIVTNGPKIISGFVMILTSIVVKLASFVPAVLQASLVLISAITQAIITNAPVIFAAVVSVMVGIVQFIVQSLPMVLAAAFGIAESIIQAIIESMPTIIQAMVDVVVALINAIVENLPKFLQMGVDLVLAIITGLVDALPQIVQAIVDNIPILISGIIGALPRLITSVVTAIIDLFVSIFSGEGPSLAEIGWNIIKGIGDGIWKAIEDLPNQLERGWNNFVQGVKDFFGIKSPSKLFAELGGYMGEGIGVGINSTDLFGDVEGNLGAFTRQVGDALTVEPSLKISADAVNSVMTGLSTAAGLAVSVAGTSAVNAVANQAIQITPAPVILDGREVGRVAFRYTDQMVGAAFGA